MKLGLVTVVLELIWLFVELKSLIVMFARWASVEVTFIRILSLAKTEPLESVGVTNCTKGFAVSIVIFLVSVLF